MRHTRSLKHRLARIAGTALLPAALAVGVGANPASADSTASMQSAARAAGTGAGSGPVWSGCAGGECATLTVPLDYTKPEAGSIRLALFRIRATDRRHRIGSLVFNYGGPGGPGVETLREARRAMAPALRARFDLVTWDPRGTGSNAVRCGRAFGRLEDSPSAAPRTTAQRRALRRLVLAAVRSCQRKTGRLLLHVGTVDTARDLDRVRAAVGDERLTYVGYSYGTFIGQVYASLFPRRVRAMVLDGVDDELGDPVAMLVRGVRGNERVLDAFLAACATHSRCAFHNRRPARAFDALAARILAHPLRVRARQLGATQFVWGVRIPLYSGKDGYGLLARALAAAQAGDGRLLLAIHDGVFDRQADGTYGTLLTTGIATICDDKVKLVSPGPRLSNRLKQIAPHFGRLLEATGDGGIDICRLWPTAPNPPKPPIRAPGAPPIVLIGTIDDVATPYEDAVAVAHRLTSGVLVTNPGRTHTSNAGSATSPCNQIAIPYLISLTVPRVGARCARS